MAGISSSKDDAFELATRTSTAATPPASGSALKTGVARSDATAVIGEHVHASCPETHDHRPAGNSNALLSFLSLLAHFSVVTRSSLIGATSSASLPPFHTCWRQAMAASSHYPYPIPGTPRVISPSPTPSEPSGKESYFGPITRSISSRASPRIPTQKTISEEDSASEISSSERENLSRGRNLDSSSRKVRAIEHSTGSAKSTGLTNSSSEAPHRTSRRKPESVVANGSADGHLSPSSASKGFPSWRELSRSPSPLGLIPIHREWRSFVSLRIPVTLPRLGPKLTLIVPQVHRHEIPRKVLHVSIGFVTLYLYIAGHQPHSLTPFLVVLLLPITTADFLRHRLPSFNDFYIRVLGALMRESEVAGWNGTIWYLLGALGALYCFPKDVGVMAVLLLSWCDTAASTFGRLYGRYTPRIRKGKSLAGSAAACAVGFGTALLFWGYFAPTFGSSYDVGENAFAFQGHLSLPGKVSAMLGLDRNTSTVTGGLALGIMGIWAGVVASASEAIDLLGWDDNLTIPVLCGVGLWGFLKVFG